MIADTEEYSEEFPDDHRMELENRIKNLLWTVSGDYTLDMKPDVDLYRRSPAIALYDGVKQGALARFFDKGQLGLYLVKKVFLGADEGLLTQVSSLCIEEAIGDRLSRERPGIPDLRRRMFEDILDQEYEKMPSFDDILGCVRFEIIRGHIMGDKASVTRRIKQFTDQIYECASCHDTSLLISTIDRLYNEMVDPDFERDHGSLSDVLGVTMEDLLEFSWEDYLSEEMYEDALEMYVEQLSGRMTAMEDQSLTQDMEQKRKKRKAITQVSPEQLAQAYSYVELNYGKSYMTEAEQRHMNYLMCRGIHSECSLYFTEGILKNPVKRNYQYEYARRLTKKNIWTYHDKHRIVKRNIQNLSEALRKSLVVRMESTEVLSDRGRIIPSRLWRVGRSAEARLFARELKGESSEFVVDVLVDASGSQMRRQGDVAIQAYIISQALSSIGFPHRVMSFCTFWDYTIMHRMRDFDDPPSANENIFNYTTSSNNRDGLAIKTAGHELLCRDEAQKIMIILSDGRPNDVILERDGKRNPIPYCGQTAIADTALEVRNLRNQGVSVLGVFAGEEKDLVAEKKIFGKDFAYIRSISGFAGIVARYLIKQLDM